MRERYGYSVAIFSDDGRTFLCSSAEGILPPVWTLSQRKFAVAYKRKLMNHGFKAKVVRVKFYDVAPC